MVGGQGDSCILATRTTYILMTQQEFQDYVRTTLRGNVPAGLRD